MEKDIEIIGYILKNYPREEGYSLPRLQRTLKIIDYKYSGMYGEPMSSIGRKTKGDILEAVELKEILQSSQYVKLYQKNLALTETPITMVSLSEEGLNEIESLGERERVVVDFVMDLTEHLTFNELFIKF